MLQTAILAVLLLLCLAHGLWFVHGLVVPPDHDMIRDLGFIQGVLDGNFFGDPINAGESRWYPPLMHFVAAAIAKVSGTDLLPMWVKAGPWLGLLTPLAFFTMCKRLLGSWSAVAATTILVLYNSAVLPSDAAISYTPIALIPALSWPIFFVGVWLIHLRAGSTKLRDALLIGTWLGLAFLAHTVPALLLSCIVTAVAFAMRGLRLSTFIWLAVVALVELAWGALFLTGLMTKYHLHIVNDVPGEWVHSLLMVPIRKWFVAVNLPGLLAIIVIWSLRRYGRLPAVSLVILATWILVCLLFLFRHYACGYVGQHGGACGVFVIAAHHYEAYLQGAWACLIGYACFLAANRLRPAFLKQRPSVRVIAIASLMLLCIGGAVGQFLQPWDLEKRRSAFASPASSFDSEAYRWMIRSTVPGDLFVTRLPQSGEPSEIGAEAAAVMAAGRRLVAAPAIHSNPYINWTQREERRVAYLEGFQGIRDVRESLCGFVTEAGPAAHAYFLLPINLRPRGDIAMPVLQTSQSTVFRVDPNVCVGSQDGAGTDRLGE